MKQKLLIVLMTILCYFTCNHSASAEEPITTYSYNAEGVIDGFVFRIYLPDDFEKTLKGYAYLVGRDKSEQAAARSNSPKRVSVPLQLWNQYQIRYGILGNHFSISSNKQDDQANNSETKPNREVGFSFGASAGKARQNTNTNNTHNTFSTLSFDNSNTATSERLSYNIDPDAMCTFELKLIGNSAFEGMSDLTEVEIPNTVTTIWPNAFKDCTNLMKVSIPESVVSIGWGAFQGCTGLESITIPKSVANIGDVAFRNCTSLKNFTFPESVVSIGWGVFWGCKNLEYVILPNNLHEIPSYLVEDCPALKTVNIPTSMTSINSDAFWETSLQTITIPENIKLIDSGAFAYCKNLRSVIIPKSLKHIATGAFCGCTSLQGIELNEGLEIIEEGAFFNSGIRQLTIPSTVKEIPEYTFQQCEKLESIILPEGLEKLGMMAFYCCENLRSIKIPNSLKRLNEKTFIGCSNLTKVEFSNGSQLKYIGPGCFAMCSSLREFDMPDSVTEIDDDSDDGVYMFMETPIERLKMSASLTSFPPLYLDETLKEISFGENSQLTIIGELAFLDYKLLKHIQFPDKLKKIETRAFEGCENLEELIFPEGLTTIENDAFYNCNKVAKIEFPLSIKTIGYTAFCCSGLKDVYVKWTENPYEGNGEEFARMSSKWVLHIPKGTMSMYKSIEPWKSFTNIVEEGSSSDDVTLTAKNYTRVYGDANPTFEYTVTSGTITSGTPTITCSATVTSPVGTYDIVIAKGTVSNSNVELVKGTLTITKAPLTISAGNYTKKEGEDNPSFKATYSGFKNSETEAVLTKKPTITTTATKTSPAGSYPVTVSGADAQNYTIAYQNGTLTITEKSTGDNPLQVGDTFTTNGMSFIVTSISPNEVQVGDNTLPAIDMNTEGAVIIPSTVKDPYRGSYSVTSIGSSAFSQCKKMTEINIPEGVTTISDAFFQCTSLTRVNIPSSVTYIGAAFNQCSALAEVHITDLKAWCGIEFMNNSTANPLVIAQHLYLNGKEVKELVIPEGTTKIGKFAFYKCNSLTSVNIPAGVTDFEERVFDSCEGLTSVTSASNLPSQTFRLCKNLTNVTLLEGVTNIGERAFRQSGLTIITIPSSLKSVESNAFSECTSLTEVHIKDVASWCAIEFGDYPLNYAHHLFMNGKEVKELVIPEGVSEIKKGVFMGCTGLSSVNIPSSVTTIGTSAFDGCTGLEEVHSEITEPFSIQTSTFSSETYTKPLYVPYGTKAKYEATSGWKNFKNIVEMNNTGFNRVLLGDKTYDVYNMQGRKVRHESTLLDGLPKGVYIINGRKVMK